jgi:thiol-disulfide isomerase/thioredoxin
MKKSILLNFSIISKIIPVIFLFSCSLTNPYYHNIRATKQVHYRPVTIDPDHHEQQPDSSIYSINSDELKHLLSTTQKEFKILIFFTNWCGGCREALPIIIPELGKKDNNLVIMITPDDWIFKNSYSNYRKRSGYPYKIYMLDVDKYGQKRSPHYRMGRFISEICTDCENVRGFASFIVFDGNNHIVLKGTGSEYINPILEIINHTKP